jgi:hypothetical protein
MARKHLEDSVLFSRSPAPSAAPQSRTICVDRRDFLQMAAATGLLPLLGFSREPEPSAATAQPKARESQSQSSEAGSIKDTAAALKNNLERLFRFVQEEVSYEPYSGVLRGPASTLAGRAGNSADQAMLLAALLTESRIPHRFVIGRLSDASIRALDAASDADAATTRGRAVKALQADTSMIRVKSDVGDTKPDSIVNSKGYAIPTSEIRQTAVRQFESSINGILSALTDAKITVTSTWSEIPRLERERHVWIQAQSGSEWIDLDPCFPGAAIGSLHADIGSTVNAIPEDMRHRVEFIASVETWTGGKLVIAPVLEFSAFADTLAGMPVCFTNVKSDDLQSLKIGGLMGGAAPMKYNAVLEIGTKMHIGETVIPFGGKPGGAGGAGGTLVDALGGGGEAVGLPDGEAIAEWLVIRLTSPGGESRSAVRPIFDRMVVGAEGAEDPGSIQPVEIIELPNGSREFLPCRTVHAFSIAGGTSSMSSLAEPPAESALGSLSWLPQAYHFVREAITTEIAPRHGIRVFLESPCVASFSIEPVAGATELLTFASFDLWHRHFGVLPIVGQKAAYPPQMVAGVLSHVAERCVSRDGYGRPTVPADLPVSVGAIFEQAKAQGLQLRALRQNLPDALPYSQEARSHFVPYLQSGIVVVIPERYSGNHSRIGWWLVNPANGRTLDRMDDGRGVTMAEFKVLSLKVMAVVGCIAALVSVVSTIYQFVGKQLKMLSQEEDEFLDKVGLVTEVFGFVTGAGCALAKLLPKPKPPPRPDRYLRRVPGGWIEM